MFNSYSVAINMKATGNKIKELRNTKHLKVSELAEIMNSSENTIFKWQRGDCLPTIDNLVVLSILFETPMDEIIQKEQLGRGDEPLLPFWPFFRSVLNIILIISQKSLLVK